MKTKSVRKLLVVLTVAMALFASLSPAASARGDSGDEIKATIPETSVLICSIDGANLCLVPSAVNWVTACVNLGLNGKPCPVVEVSAADMHLTAVDAKGARRG